MCLEANIQIHRMYRAAADELILNCFDDGRGLTGSPTASLYIRGEGQGCFPQYKAMIDTVVNGRTQS